MISSSEGLCFAAGAGDLPSLLDEAIDGGWMKDLIRCDEDPTWDVDGELASGAASFCPVEGSEALPPKNLRAASLGGAMDEDVLRAAEIKVPTLEGFKLEGPGIEDGSFGTAIIITSAPIKFQTPSLDTPAAGRVPMPPLISDPLTLGRFGAVLKSQPPSFLLRG